MICNSLGNGIFITISTLYFINILGISPLFYSVVLLVAGALGLFFGTYLGHLADLFGSKKIYCIALLIQGCCSIGYLFGNNIIVFIVCLIGSITFERGAASARGVMMVEIVPRQERVRFRALTRSIVNGTACIGAALGALVLFKNADIYFSTAILFNGSTFIITALIFSLMTIKEKTGPKNIEKKSTDIQSTSIMAALSDKKFLLITILNSILTLHSAIITIAIPIWISQYSKLPIWLVSAVIFMNTIGVILLQVRVGKNVKNLTDASKVAQRAGFCLSVTCILIGLSTDVPIEIGIVMILLAGISQLFGELFQAVSGWMFSFELCPEDAYGKYQGIFNAGQDISLLISPLVFTSLVMPAGITGWIGLSIIFIITAIFTKKIVTKAIVEKNIVLNEA